MNRAQVALPAVPLGVRVRARLGPGVQQLCIGGGLLALLVVLAAFGPAFVPLHALNSAGSDLGPSPQHLMGTGVHGEDIFEQWVHAARYSLTVGLLAGLGSTALSVLIGVTAGYVGGWVDEALGFIMNLFLFVPPFPAIFVLAFGLAVQGPLPLVALITVMTWAYGASLLRSFAKSLRTREFVAASSAAGESWWRVVWHEVLPHLGGLTLFVLVSAVLFALQTEFGLEFLGLGVGGSTGLGGGWGIMLYNAHYDNDFQAGFWWTWVFPGLGITLTSIGLAIMGTGVLARSRTR